MAKCFYCGKKSFRGIDWPIHPKDGIGTCCKECWRSRVAEVGLTKATGNIKLDKAAVEAYGKKARECYDWGDYEEALANLDKLVELSHKSKIREVHYGWYFLRGDCHMRLGHVEEAKSDLSIAEALYKEPLITSWSGLLSSAARGDVRMHIRSLLEMLGSYNSQACARVCSLLDEIVETYDLEGSASEELRQGWIEKGLYRLPGLIPHGGYHIPMWELEEVDPVRYFTYSGVSCILLGKFKKAIEYLEQLTKADPTNAAAYYFLGSARVKQYDETHAKGGIFLKRKLRILKSKAKNDFLKALSLSPNHILVSQIEKQISKLGESLRTIPLGKRAYCTRCGAELKEDAKFCHKCGQAVTS